KKWRDTGQTYRNLSRDRLLPRYRIGSMGPRNNKEELPMATSVEELLNMLFDMVDEARNAPLSSEKCVIERDKALDLIEDAKAQLPVELAEARKVLNNRNELLSSAKREAEELQKRAENEARRLVSETEVMAVARQKASEMMAQADQKSKEMRTVANQYCEDVMRRAQ